MYLMFLAVTQMDVSDGTLVAISIGGVVTFLLSMRKGRPMRTVIAYTIAAVGSGYDLSSFLASKLGMSRLAASWLISVLGWVVIPLLPWAAKKYLKESDHGD